MYTLRPALRQQAGVGDDLEVADPGADAVRDDRRDRAHERVRQHVAGAEAAIVGAGKRGLASDPSGAWIEMGRNRPELAGTCGWVVLSRRIERRVR